jgi:pilus assembly protein CpaE
MDVAAMNKTLTVLLIEDSSDYAALVQQWLSLITDINFVLHWTDSLAAGLSRLKQGGVDVILLDLGLPDSNGVETFTRTKLKASGVPVILLSGDSSERLALQLVQAGAQDYIVKGGCNGETLAKALQYAVMRNANRGSEESAGVAEQATVSGVMGGKGGVGATTIACNLAAELRRQTDQKTLLVDLDLDGGLVSFMMNAESEYTVLDATANIDRLDASFWGGLVAHYPGGMDILRAPGVPGVAEPSTDSLRQVIELVRKLYRWVVVDLGRPSGLSLGLLDQLSEVLLVTTTDVPALYEARRAVDGLRRAGVAGDRIKMIVNPFSAKQELGAAELDRLFGVPVYATFSAAGRELHQACVQKRLPEETSVFGGEMAALARKLAGLQPEKSRSRVAQMFSRSKKPSDMDKRASVAPSF